MNYKISDRSYKNHYKMYMMSKKIYTFGIIQYDLNTRVQNDCEAEKRDERKALSFLRTNNKSYEHIGGASKLIVVIA